MSKEPKSKCGGKNQDGSTATFHSIDYGVCQSCGKTQAVIDREQGKVKRKRRYARR